MSYGQLTAVLTTIQRPTGAVSRLVEKLNPLGSPLVVIGDAKGPPDYDLPGVDFYSLERQRQLPYRLAKLLPVHHYARKNLGYLVAIQRGAAYLYETDDDNMPQENWRHPDFAGEYSTTPENLGFLNVYRLFTDQPLWPRGFPLNRITGEETLLREQELRQQESNVGIWQGLADGDPDVDAIYRLTNNTPCIFQRRDPVVFARGTLCPFNSQNTLFRREVFPLLYLPVHVTFRFTDILRGLVAQPILWAAGYQLGFFEATVYQDRNQHDYMKDFASEIPCYLYAEKVVDIVTGCVTSRYTMEDNLFNAYESLHRHQIVNKEELPLLTAWLKDIREVKSLPLPERMVIPGEQ